MQHAGIQYGQGAANSHQSPPFVHADISQTNGGNTTSSLRQFRKKDGLDKNSSTDLNTSENIARVAPHSHYPPRANDYYRYHHQYDYNSPFKEPTAQVKYSEIAETPPQPHQHVDPLASLQKHKEPHKDFMDMCNITQQAHMKQTYTDNLTRQQSYPPDAATVHQYLHKEAQVHNYKPESQYQQYPQLSKYNMPSQCRKYPPPPPENDFLAKLQRINPSMARSIISDHHIRESQANYSMEQNRMYQNQRYYPHLQNNPAYNYHMPQPYNYPSCNYKHPDYARANQMAVGGTQYPTPDRSLSPRNLHMPMNYAAAPQKISPNYTQYNHPEYAQHYQHRRTSLPQDYYQQTCRTNPYISTHPQISPEANDNRASSGLRHFIENWAEEEASGEIAPIYKENIRLHNDSTNEQVFVINSSEIPIENLALVPTENGQYILKGANLDNSVVRVKETTENNGERTVNLQIVETASKPDCMLAETPQDKTNEDPASVPYPENQTKDCDEENIKTNTVQEEKDDEGKTVEEEPQLNTPTNEEIAEKIEENSAETSVIVCNELSVIKDMPLIEEDHENKTTPLASSPPTSPQPTTPPEPELDEEEAKEEETPTQSEDKEDNEEPEEKNEPELPETSVTSTTKRTQRIFSVDDIINNIGPTSNQTRRNSLQLNKIGDEESKEDTSEETPLEDKEAEDPQSEEVEEEIEFANAISVEDDSVILEIGGALVQLNINNFNGTKILSVLPLSESLVIDVNGNYQESQVAEDADYEECQDTPIEEPEQIEEENLQPVQEAEDISTGVCQSEIVIGEESMDNEIFIDLTAELTTTTTINEEEPIIQETAIIEKEKVEVIAPIVVAPEAKKPTKRKERKISIEDKKKCKESEDNKKKLKEIEDEKKPKETDDEKKRSKETDDEKKKPKEPDEEKKKPKEIDSERRKPKDVDDEKKKSKEAEDDKKKPTTKKTKDHERKDSEERLKGKRTLKVDVDDETKTRKPKSIDEKKKLEEKPIEDDEIKVRKPKPDEEKRKLEEKPIDDDTKVKKPKPDEEKKKVDDKPIDNDDLKSRKPKLVEEKRKVDDKPIEDDIKVRKPKPVEEMNKKVDDKPIEETKSEKAPNFSTKAAKKQYANEIPCKKTTKDKEIKKIEEKIQPKVSKLEETVNKIKSLKEKSSAEETKAKKPSIKDVNEKKIKIPKRVTFNLETEIREITNDEIDRKKLSWEEYNSRKRRLPPEYQEKKIMEDTVTSSEDINDQVVEQVELSIENAMKKKSPPRVINNNWEDDPDSPKMEEKNEVIPKINRCIIDVNEFNIKPIESASTPSPVSSTQFSYSEDDSLQVYKDVVDSKLNSLNIKIPKVKPKPVDQFSVLLERFLNKASLDGAELEKVKKIIEFKRKIEEKQLTYEVRNERDKDLKLHLRKVPEKSRNRKRFRNLYADDTSDESDSSRDGVEGEAVGDYSVYQRNSAGVPKLIFKRKSGLPQPFVKLERSQAVELLAKKRKLY